jgi:hypothetical protein
MGYVCKTDVAKALKMQSYRRDKGQKVPRIGVLLERMGCITANQIQTVSGGCLSKPAEMVKAIGKGPSSDRFAPALQPIRRLNGNVAVNQALGWLGRDEPKAKAKNGSKGTAVKTPRTPRAPKSARQTTRSHRIRPATQTPKAPKPTPEPTPEPTSESTFESRAETKLQRAVRAVLEPAPRAQHLVQDELDRLRETIGRLTLRLAKVETEADTLRGERDTARDELAAVTNAMIFKEDLIDALRNQVKRLGS